MSSVVCGRSYTHCRPQSAFLVRTTQRKLDEEKPAGAGDMPLDDFPDVRSGVFGVMELGALSGIAEQSSNGGWEGTEQNKRS